MIGAQLVNQCPDDAIDQAFLTLSRLCAAERRQGTGQSVLQKLRKRAVSLIAINGCQGIETGVRELIQVLLRRERQKSFVEAGMHGAFLTGPALTAQA